MADWLGGQAEAGERQKLPSSQEVPIQNLKRAVVLKGPQDIQDILQLKPSDQGEGGRERVG